MLDPSFFETSQNGSCNTPAKLTNNVIIFSENTEYLGSNLIGTTSERSADSPMVTLR
ncbi:hypothetical protein KKH82_01820 [Patescibacteria group bacterium]|nr:hypothetical protein [Patescibacteria group bacterium]